MANTTDFISAVYDELAKMLSISDSTPSIVMQMAWPGYSLSPSDFKRSDAPNGAYDPDAAREAFSQLANIAPVMSKARFENSGFELDDLYEILISSAIPTGVVQSDLPANPIHRLFSDAQYELLQARRGLHDDPNSFYYPCSATPANWYEDAAAASWPSITLKQTDVKPATPASSPFARRGGLDLTKQGVWRMKPQVADAGAIKSRMLESVAKFGGARVPAAAGRAAPVALKPAGRVAPKPSGVAKPGLARDVAALARPFKLPIAPDKLRAPGFAESLNLERSKALFSRMAPTNAVASRAAGLAGLDLSRRDLGVHRLADRFVMKNLLDQQLPAKPASPATDGHSISFKFCRVNIERPWFKLALLSTKNWWMFDTQQGEYSTGADDPNPGMFPLLTTSFIVIRDLKITANWSQEDRQNLGNATSFGFFDIRDGSLNQNTLEVKGMQIIAWVSRVMPKLPPLSPP